MRDDETGTSETTASTGTPDAAKAKRKAGRGSNGHDDNPPKRVKAKAKQTAAAPKAKAAKPKKVAVKAKGAAKKQATESKVARDQFGFKQGTKKSKAAALYSSKKGATLEEVKKVTGSIQFNLLTQLEDAGFKITREQEPGKGNRQVTRYFLIAK